MTDIIIRNSDGRVQVVGTTITDSADRFEVVEPGGVIAHVPHESYDYPVSIVTGVTGVPSDLVGGWNYNYVSGAFASSGVAAPNQPAVSPWLGKAVLKTSKFIAVVSKAIGGVAWKRIQDDPNGAPVYAEVLTAPTVDPNDPDFQAALGGLLTTDGADAGGKLLISANVTAILAGWPSA